MRELIEAGHKISDGELEAAAAEMDNLAAERPPSAPRKLSLPLTEDEYVANRRVCERDHVNRGRRECKLTGRTIFDHARAGDCPLRKFPHQIKAPAAAKAVAPAPLRHQSAVKAVRPPPTDEELKALAATIPSEPIADPAAWIKTYFDRAVVISLERTPDRLREFRANIDAIGWPLCPITTFVAIDGLKEKPPGWYREGGPAWGCLQSQRHILADAMRDGVNRLLIMEDDAAFPADFADRLFRFLSRVPSRWDCLMIGGQQHRDGWHREVVPGVKLVTQCERTHCYALSRFGIESLYRWFSESMTGHCDWQLGDWQEIKGIRAYRPDPIISFQRANFSTIRYRQEPARSWDGKVKFATRKVDVVRLKCSGDVLRSLRSRGLVHSGYRRDGDDIDRGLADLIGKPDAKERFRKWSDMLKDEASAFDRAVAAVWWPEEDARIDMICAGLSIMDGNDGALAPKDKNSR